MVNGMTAKKTIFLLIFNFLSMHLCFADPMDSSYHIFEDMHTFSTNYPRTENSPGELESLRFIEETLDELGATYTIKSLDSYEGFHSFSSTVEAVFQGTPQDRNMGQNAGEEKLYLLFPLNHPADAPGDSDGSAGLALALQICRVLIVSPPPVEVRILFLGAEFGRDPGYHLGSRAFLQDFSSHGEAALLYFDLRRFSGRLRFQPAGTGKVAPAWLVRYTGNTLSRSGIAYDFSPMGFNIHQMGFNEQETGIDPFLENEIPSVYLTSTGDARPGTAMEPEVLQNFLLKYIENFPRPTPQRWDRHYLLFKWEDVSFLLPELIYVMTLLVLFAAVLLYPFFQRKRFYRYLRSIRKNGWVLPIIYTLMFLYLLLATFLIEGLASLRRLPFLWRESPFLLLALKVGFAVFLFSLSHRITTPFHFGRLRGSFYSASGLFFLLINVVLFTLFNLSLTIYGTLLFLLGFLFSVARSRSMKLTWLMISILLILGLLLQVFREGSSTLTYGVLLSRFRGNLLISLQLLPYMLFILRLRVLFHLPSRPRSRRYTLIVELLFGLLSTAIVIYFAFFYFPVFKDGQKLTVTEELGTRHTINFESPLPLESMEFRSINGEQKSLNLSEETPGEVTVELPPCEGILSYGLDSKNFLGRTTYAVTLNAPDFSVFPDMLYPVLESAGETTIYDSDFPYSIRTDLNRVQFYIGRNPGFPFRFSFTVPAEMEAVLRIGVVYQNPPYDIGINLEKFDLEYTLNAEISVSIPEASETADTADPVDTAEAAAPAEAAEQTGDKAAGPVEKVSN